MFHCRRTVRGSALAAVLAITVTPAWAQASGGAGGFEVYEATISELADALTTGRTSSVELVDAYLARIRAYDHAGPALNAVMRLNPNARSDAAALDRERGERGARGPLHGIPVLVKDNYEVSGLTTSAGTVALAGWIPDQDAAVVRRLRAAGAVILGMTNMHELAHGITTIASIGGQTRNPYDPRRNPGGSSGGTGAAIASSFAAIGWGSDTCGSIRIPAAHQNMFGLRPTFGMFSTEGIVPLAHSQDVPGPLARSAMDLAIGLDATVGPESAITNPVTGEARTPRFQAALGASKLVGTRIGILTNYFGSGDEAEAANIVRAALDSIDARGAEVVEVEIPNLDDLLSGSSVISWELKWDLNDFLKERPTAPIRSFSEILERGLYMHSMEEAFRARDTVSSRDTEGRRAVLAKQARVREVLSIVFAANELDAIAYPTIRRKAAVIGEGQRGSSCRLSAASGFPAITMPAGLTGDGLPIGLELLGRAYSDEQLVGLAYAYEQATSPRRPPSSTPPLEEGRAPEAVSLVARAVGSKGESAEALFVFDVTASTLGYSVSVAGAPVDAVYAVTLDVMEDGRDGGVAHRLVRSGQLEATGTIRLGFADRRALMEGRFALTLYTQANPAGATGSRLVLPTDPQSR